MKGVLLVPRRNDNGHRDAVWKWVRQWWAKHLPELPVYEGHHDGGLFNRSAAVNRAAASAGDWDVAVIIDSDVICDPDRVRDAIVLAHRWQDRMVMPFSRRHNLTQSGTRLLMRGFAGSWQKFIAKTYDEMCSSVIMVPRPLWDQVGGFDEQFSGWGFEDNAFALACQTFGGQTIHKIEGECWHLWHPTAKEGNPRSPSHAANKARAELYAAALGDKEATRALAAGLDWRPPVSLRVERIPRILHRTVPEQTTPEVEGWWAKFWVLHPDWTLMTHRDPMDPADWPLTGHLWGSCDSGAQKAGLIRLEALIRWGGVYVDSDCEPYRSLEPLLGNHAFAGWEDERVVPDAVIGAEPDHPALRLALSLAIERLPQGAWESGAGVTTAIFPGRDDVLLLPPGAFYPYHYKEKHRRREDHMAKQPWAFMAHHWAGSWLPKKA